MFDKQGQNTMGLDSKAGHVKKGGAVEEYFEFLLPSEPERDEWLAAVRAAMPEVTGSVYTGEAKQGVIFMQNARHKWKARHCTLSSSGFVTSDSMEGTIPMRANQQILGCVGCTTATSDMQGSGRLLKAHSLMDTKPGPLKLT